MTITRRKQAFSFPSEQLQAVKHKMLYWSNQYSILLLLDSNNYQHKAGKYELLCAADAIASVDSHQPDALTALQQAHDQSADWFFGHINYDYKNRLETLGSVHVQKMGFPDFYFFRPRVVCYIEKANPDTLVIETDDHVTPAAIWQDILQTQITGTDIPGLKFEASIAKNDYLDIIEQLRGHIAAGDCYEINYCNEAHVARAAVRPCDCYRVLSGNSPAPFAAYYRHHNSYMMCASPERYLRKQGAVLLAQPIKGTAKRDGRPEVDERHKKQLFENIKERAENVMITDLMRNDLARVSEPGSVQVDELFGIYSFPQVHQMISTVSAKMRTGVPFTDAIRYSFPMGSMTGAPKIKVMQLIDRYERCRRELFSGTVGYIDPSGDFDFNVVIRSLFYNSETQYLSYQTGGAITYDSNPEMEWEETRVKAAALENVFHKDID